MFLFHRSIRRLVAVPFFLSSVCVPLAWLSTGAALAADGDASVTGQSSQHFSIPAGSLSASLNALARQAGLTLSVDPALVSGKSAAAISGSYTVPQALQLILSGSGLTYRFSNTGNAVLIQAEPASSAPATLPTLMVEGQLDRGSNAGGETATGPVEGYVATRSATATKTDTPLLETPRSVSVIGANQIEAQSANNIDETLRYTAGIASEYRGIDRSRTDIVLRGFIEGFVFTDGMRSGRAGYGDDDVDPYGLERVEVLKGPASILYGAGSPGGIVNVVSKRPRDDFFAEVGVNAGNYSQAGAKFDINGSVNDTGNLLGRFTGLVRAGDSQVDFNEENRTFLAPALTWNASPKTALTLLSKYQKDEGPWATFLPAVGTVLSNPNGHIPTNRQFGEPDYTSGYDREFASLGYILVHSFDDRLRLRHSLRFSNYEFKGRGASGWGWDTGLNDNRTVLRGPFYGEEEGDALVTDTNVQKSFILGTAEHTVLAGVDYKKSSTTAAYGEANPDPSWNLDIFNPVYGVADFPSPEEILRDWIYLNEDQDLSQTGLYVQDQIDVGQWVLNIGARYDQAESSTRSKLDGSTTKDQDDAFTGQAGVVYLFNNGFSPYANYAESFEPLVGTDFSGKKFEPITGTQYEVGVKYEPPGSSSLITVSLFEITRQNSLTSDLQHPGFSIQKGEVRSRGYEIEARINVSERLNVVAAYSHVDAEITKSNDGDEGLRQGQTPDMQTSLWTNYDFSNGLSINGGVRHIGSSLDYANEIKVPAYTLVDAGLRYDFSRQWQGLSFTLNASNLTDKTYVASCEGEFWCIYGLRRVVTAGAMYRW